ncbi:hypothetical protein CSUI_004408 [Cystoisospora suis]|uniref:Uncharacterized protein n=1 Tax=Cystoisospora suis TaxID=483139 RepID=A0A2C6L0L8_9APIC|nr:hypothetical protein CSUI_004408 [Cystoisospora suis]
MDTPRPRQYYGPAEGQGGGRSVWKERLAIPFRRIRDMILERFGTWEDDKCNARPPESKEQADWKFSWCRIPFLHRKKETSFSKLVGVSSPMPKRFRIRPRSRFFNRRRWCFSYVYSARHRRVVIAWETRGKMPRCVPVDKVLPPREHCFWGTPSSGKARREAFLARRAFAGTAVNPGFVTAPSKLSSAPFKPCRVRHHRRWEDPVLRELPPRSKRRPRLSPKKNCVIDAQIHICHFSEEDAPNVVCIAGKDIKPVIVLRHPERKNLLAQATEQGAVRESCRGSIPTACCKTREASEPNRPSAGREVQFAAKGVPTCSVADLLLAEAVPAASTDTGAVQATPAQLGWAVGLRKENGIRASASASRDSLEALPRRALGYSGIFRSDTTSTAETAGIGETKGQLIRFSKV